MMQPPGAPPPPPPPPAYGGQSPSAWGPPARTSGHGRVSPGRLILVFVVVLGIGLALGAAVVLALQPAARKAECPDPAVQCRQPPIAPTLPPTGRASAAPAATPAPTIIRPSGTLAIPSTQPSTRPTAAPAGSPAASAPASTAPTTAPTTPPIAGLPEPLLASDVAALRIGEVWSSSEMGFTVEYSGRTWSIQDETATSVVLTAGNGAVLLSIEGFPASAASPKALLQQKVTSLGDLVLGLTEETDPARQLPGQPIVGHRQGFGVLMNGTIDTPQGPSANVDVVILAATDSTITIRVTLITDDDLRDPAFAVVDSILNSLEWPAGTP